MALSQLETRLRILIKAVEQSPVSIVVTDYQGIIEYVNPKFTQATGYAPEEAVGRTPRILKSGQLGKEFYRELWETIKAGQEWHGIFHNRTKDGSLLWELASISPIRDDEGTITHFVGVKEDITELKRLQEQTTHQAQHDGLTGLANRVLFYDHLKHALSLAKRRQAGFAVFYLDLDGFKTVNDTLGHLAGDQLLTLMARRLVESVRESDTVARMGGDEFTIILEDLDSRPRAAEIAELILANLAKPCRIGTKELCLSASIGISFYPQDEETPDRLISSADSAMYVAKHGGRNTFVFASAEPGDRAVQIPKA